MVVVVATVAVAMSLDEDQVLTASKEYDFECVQWLSLVSMDLRDICVLSQCPNLVELDISKNRIFSLRGLEGAQHSSLHWSSCACLYQATLDWNHLSVVLVLWSLFLCLPVLLLLLLFSCS